MSPMEERHIRIVAWRATRSQFNAKHLRCQILRHFVCNAEWLVFELIVFGRERFDRRQNLASSCRIVDACILGISSAARGVLRVRFENRRWGDGASSSVVIQALDVDRAEPWPDGPDRQKDQALPV
jgi:hypothetical protein